MRRENDGLTIPVTLALTLLLTPFGLAVRRLVPGTAEDALRYDLCMLAQEALMWGMPALALAPRKKREAAGKSTPWVWLALPLGAALQAGLSALMTMMNVPGTGRVPNHDGAGMWLLGAAALAVIPALCEEAFFRGALLTALRKRMSAGGAFAAVTAIFALMHASPTALPPHLAVSAMCTLLAMACGSLWPPVLFHLGYNGAALILARLPETDALGMLILLPLGACVCLARQTGWKTPPGGLKSWEKAALALECAVLIARYLN